MSEALAQQLDAWLAKQDSEEKKIAAAAEALAKVFKVTPDEVSLFRLDTEADQLRFLWPPSLQKSGTVPLSSKQSLSVKTVKENKAFVNNNFTTVTHSSIFEMMSKAALPIQKIMSVPLAIEGTVKGLVQVCRKGRSTDEAGADFVKSDLGTLMTAVQVIAKHLQFG